MIIKNEIIKKLQCEQGKLKGTNAYKQFDMEISTKTNNKWSFIGWGIPQTKEDMIIKKVQDKHYLMTLDKEYRYMISDEANSILQVY